MEPYHLLVQFSQTQESLTKGTETNQLYQTTTELGNCTTVAQAV